MWRSNNLQLVLWLAALAFWLSLVQAELRCIRDADCQARLEGSVCQTSVCVSPFHIGGGCFAHKGIDTFRRVCHSEDPPDAAAKGYCRPPDEGLDYVEIRIQTQVSVVLPKGG